MFLFCKIQSVLELMDRSVLFHSHARGCGVTCTFDSYKGSKSKVSTERSWPWLFLISNKHIAEVQ